jgi:transposase-like protein
VSVALAAGGSESTVAWGDFLEALRTRGLRAPLLIISDGAGGGMPHAANTGFGAGRRGCIVNMLASRNR